MSNQIEIYQTKDGHAAVEVRFDNESVWLTQKQMAKVFNTTPQNITIHLKNIFQEGELKEYATSKDYLQVQLEGTRTINRTEERRTVYAAKVSVFRNTTLALGHVRAKASVSCPLANFVSN